MVDELQRNVGFFRTSHHVLGTFSLTGPRMAVKHSAETTLHAFVAINLHKGSNRGSWKPLQQGWTKREKKEPRREGNPPLSFAQFIRAHPQGFFVCYVRSFPFQHDHRTCPIHKADTEAYKKAHRTKKRASANIREDKVEVSREEFSKLIMVRTQLPKEIKENERPWEPKDDKEKDKDTVRDKDKKAKSRWKKKGDAVSEVAAEEDTPTTDTS